MRESKQPPLKKNETTEPSLLPKEFITAAVSVTFKFNEMWL